MTGNAAHGTPQQDSASPSSIHISQVPAADRNLKRSQRERFAMLLGDRKAAVGLLALASVVAAVCEASLLAIAARGAIALVENSDTQHVKFGPVSLNLSTPRLLYIGVGLAVLRLLLQAPTSYLPAQISGDVQAAMRTQLMRAYSSASWEKQSQDREGHFQELMSNQVQQASAGALQTTQLIVAICTFLILVSGAFALDPAAAIVVFVAAIAMLLVLRPANSLAMRQARLLSAAQLEYAGAVGEANRLTEETNVFGVIGPQGERVGHFITVARELFVQVQILSRAVPNLYQSLIYLILVGGLLAVSLSHLSHLSELGAVVLLLVRAGSYGQQVQTLWVALRQSLPFVERVQNAINGYSESRPSRGNMPLATIESLAFDKVSYFYRADQPVLHDISFGVARGETIGVVGPSGAGKSTMLQILLSLRNPRSGRFLINGIDATQISIADLHQRIAYVPQQPKLLHATVADNVRFHRDYDDAAVERACRLARVHDEIMAWPAGYQTTVGPRADAVSGGQQQRICLARALVSNPSILLLDEPTSALDPRSEALIQQSLEALQDQMTLFIIAHRISTLSICDRVMVLLNGTIDAFATLQELSQFNDYYQFASGFASASASPG